MSEDDPVFVLPVHSVLQNNYQLPPCFSQERYEMLMDVRNRKIFIFKHCFGNCLALFDEGKCNKVRSLDVKGHLFLK